MSVDLFLVVKDLGVGFTGRWNSLLDLDGSVLLSRACRTIAVA
jgi:hypothetical protein